MARPLKHPDPPAWPSRIGDREMMLVIGVSQPKSLHKLIDEGMPRREDGYFDLLIVGPWLMHRSGDELTLKAEKTVQETARITLQVEKLGMEVAIAKAESIPKSEHNKIAVDWARFAVSRIQFRTEEAIPIMVGIQTLDDARGVAKLIAHNTISDLSQSTPTDQPDTETHAEAVEKKPVHRRPARRISRGYQAASTDIGLVF